MNTIKKAKVTKKQKVAFARRFSYEDWMKVCGSSKIEEAINAGEFDLAEVLAHEILNPEMQSVVDGAHLEGMEALEAKLPAGAMPHPLNLKGPLNNETVVITGWSALPHGRHDWEMWYNSMEAARAALKMKEGHLFGDYIHPEICYDFTAGRCYEIEASDRE